MAIESRGDWWVIGGYWELLADSGLCGRVGIPIISVSASRRKLCGSECFIILEGEKGISGMRSRG